MKTIFYYITLFFFLSGSAFSQVPINIDYSGRGLKSSPYGGFELFPRWAMNGGHSPVAYKDLKKWMKGYAKTFKKHSGKKIVLIEQGSSVEPIGSRRSGIYIGGQPANPSRADFENSRIRLTSANISPQAFLATLLVAFEKDRESVYYNMAINPNLSEHHSFDDMVEYANAYLEKFPKGKLEYRRNVKKRLHDIYEIPLAIRQLQVSEVIAAARKQREDRYNAQRDASLLFWSIVGEIFLSGEDGGSTVGSSRDSQPCTACSGKGRVWQYACMTCDNGGYSTCYQCNGSGKR